MMCVNRKVHFGFIGAESGFRVVMINGFKWTPLVWTLSETGTNMRKRELVSCWSYGCMWAIFLHHRPSIYSILSSFFFAKPQTTINLNMVSHFFLIPSISWILLPETNQLNSRPNHLSTGQTHAEISNNLQNNRYRSLIVNYEHVVQCMSVRDLKNLKEKTQNWTKIRLQPLWFAIILRFLTFI